MPHYEPGEELPTRLRPKKKGRVRRLLRKIFRRSSAGLVGQGFLVKVLLVLAIVAVLIFILLHLSIGVHPHN